LGTGDSGKTTVAKQLQILHLNGFSEKERIYYRDIIHSNIFSAMSCIIAESRKLKFEIEPEHIQLAEEIRERSESLTERVLTKPWVEKIKILLQDTGIKHTLENVNQLNWQESVTYFFDHLDRLVDNFVPTDDDILRVRVKTTGVKELNFKQEQYMFSLVDVGGQRGERKKWIHSFEGVRTVLFCVALSEYDLKLVEDSTVNRMSESIKLFDEVCNSRWFNSTPIIIFLNKNDLFEQKIKKVDLKVCFPEYEGGCDYEKALEFIKKQFISLDTNEKRAIFTHITTATNTENIRVVFGCVKEIIVQEALNEMKF